MNEFENTQLFYLKSKSTPMFYIHGKKKFFRKGDVIKEEDMVMKKGHHGALLFDEHNANLLIAKRNGLLVKVKEEDVLDRLKKI